MLSVPFPSPALSLYSDSMHCPWVGIVKILCQIASLPPPTLTLPPAMGVGGKMRLDTGDMHPLHCPDWRKKRARQATRLLFSLFLLFPAKSFEAQLSCSPLVCTVFSLSDTLQRWSRRHLRSSTACGSTEI